MPTTGQCEGNQNGAEELRRMREMFARSPSFSALLQGPEHRFVLANPAYHHLLISDVILPHVNGRKLAEIARTSRPTLKVLLVSGYAENAVVRGDFDAGMDMLTKPFALDTLGAKVHEMIKGRAE